MGAELVLDQGHLACRRLEPLAQDAAELREIDFAGQQLVLGDDEVEQVSAEPACREGADNDVRVEERPSRHIAEDVLVRQIAGGLAVGHEAAPPLIEPEQRDLAAKRVPYDFTARPAESTAQAVELPLELGVEANGHGAHV